MSVPGIGPITSSAMVAAIGGGDAFSKGRDFARRKRKPCHWKLQRARRGRGLIRWYRSWVMLLYVRRHMQQTQGSFIRGV
jgi:transposase